MQEIMGRLKRRSDKKIVPVILFTKGGGAWAETIAASGCDAMGLDWTVDLGDVRRRTAGKVALQGNMDPAVLHGSEDAIRSEAAAILAAYGPGPGHVFNLGHGISQHADPGRLKVLVDAVHDLSAPYHQV